MQVTVNKDKICIQVQKTVYIVNINDIIRINAPYDNGTRIYFIIDTNNDTEYDISYYIYKNMTNVEKNKALEKMQVIYESIVDLCKAKVITKNIFTV